MSKPHSPAAAAEATAGNRRKRKTGGDRSASGAGTRRVGKADTGPVVIAFPVNCGLHEIKSLWAQLAAALEAGTPIRLDASKLENTDTSVVQLLSAFAAEARRLRRPLCWATPGAALGDAAALLGLEGPLDLPGGQNPSIDN